MLSGNYRAVIPGVYGQLYLLSSSVLGPGQLSGDNISEEERASQACWRQVMMMMMMLIMTMMMVMVIIMMTCKDCIQQGEHQQHLLDREFSAR